MEDDCDERIAAVESLAQLQQQSYLQSSVDDNNSQLELYDEPTPLDHDFRDHEVFYEEPTQESKHVQHTSNPNTQIVAYIDPTNSKPLGTDTSEYYKMPSGIKSPAEVIAWAKETALKNKCVLVRNTQGSNRRFEMVCERSGEYKAKNSHKRKGYVYEKKTNRVYKTHTRKDNCPFKLVFYLIDKVDEWDCTVWFGQHNHPDPKDFNGHSIVAKLKPREFEDVKIMTKACIKPRVILRTFKERDDQNVSSLSTIYSAQATIRRVEWEGRSVMQEFEKLVWDHNYTRIIKRGPDEKPLQIFIAHPLLSQLAHTCCGVLMMDCTYKTNKYNMSLFNIVGQTSDKVTFTLAWCLMENERDYNYHWALRQLKLLFPENQFPRVIVTDQDDALMDAISDVFPDAQNFLCTYHIGQNVTKHCHALFEPSKADIKKRMIAQLEEDVRKKKLSPEEEEDERGNIKERVDKEHDENHKKWLEVDEVSNSQK